jgi:hypothetical protein
MCIAKWPFRETDDCWSKISVLCKISSQFVENQFVEIRDCRVVQRWASKPSNTVAACRKGKTKVIWPRSLNSFPGTSKFNQNTRSMREEWLEMSATRTGTRMGEWAVHIKFRQRDPIRFRGRKTCEFLMFISGRYTCIWLFAQFYLKGILIHSIQ